MTAELHKIDRCKACEAPIIWSETSTGHAMPVDASPVDDGNVLLFPTADRKYVAIVVAKTEAGAWAGRERYKSHFATCPAAAAFRRKGVRKARP